MKKHQKLKINQGLNQKKTLIQSKLKQLSQMSWFQLSLGLTLSLMTSLNTAVFAQGKAEVNINVTESSPAGDPPQCEETKYGLGNQIRTAENIELFYLRSAPAMVTILSDLAKKNPCLGGTVITAQGNTLVLYGTEAEREELKRFASILDLRREGVDMALWGIIISSDNPGQLAEAMKRINQEVKKTRDLLVETYLAFAENARDINIDPEFQLVFQQLGYGSAFEDSSPYLSMVDILLRILAAKDPDQNYLNIANNICTFFFEEHPAKFRYYTQQLDTRPFDNYLKVVARGLNDNLGNQCNNYRYKPSIAERKRKLRRTQAVLSFALNYAYLKQQPDRFDPDFLQKSAEDLNTVLGVVVDAINRDVEELFMKPTLKKIQEIVSEFCDVEYAEVGKTTVAGLNQIPATVASTTVSAFDETGPLRANELLEEAGRLNQYSKDLFPILGETEVPASSIVSLIAALSQDRSLWRALTSGVSLEITPSVLRNSTSAELTIDLTTAPTNTQEVTGDGEVRPLSRLSQNRVSTTVYVNTLDLFALSTFNSQTTIDGGRTYIPVIGTIWQGLFSGVPGVWRTI